MYKNKHSMHLVSKHFLPLKRAIKFIIYVSFSTNAFKTPRNALSASGIAMNMCDRNVVQYKII